MKKLLIVLVVLIVIGVAAAFGAVSYFSMPAVPHDTTEISVVIPKGKGLAWVATELEKQGIVRNALVFRILGMKEGLATKIQAGTYTLSKSLSVHEIFTTLQKGTDDTWVTILEGWRREEVAEELGRVLGEGFDTKLFLVATKDREGYLYPDTYLFPKDVEPYQVASYMKNNFDNRITEDMLYDIGRQGRKIDEIITLASIIEREGNSKESKEMISGILMNRMLIGMPLQVDATLQYVKGYDEKEKSWWVPPLAVDKSLSSPYNTYKNAGLPPGPICSPGLDSIEAAIYPEPSDYLYYITGNDGKMYYAETLEQHNANVEKYLR